MSTLPEMQVHRSLRFNRWLALGVAANYLIWHYVVEIALPGSYNPIGSRVAVVLLFVSLFVSSFISSEIKKNISTYLTICLWIVTLHLFYLFYMNNSDINWIVGSYTAVTGIISVLQDEISLLAYSCFVLVLSFLLAFLHPELFHSIFLIGMLTFVVFGFFGSRNRVRSERNRILYEASVEAIKNRDEFFSIAAHELKTPLTSIKIQTQMAMMVLSKEDSSLSPERMKNFILQTDRQTNRLSKLVNEMLDSATISAGKMTLDKVHFDLVALVKKTAEHFNAYPIQINATGPISIHADEFRIEQVIENLISNAQKYGKNLPIQIDLRQTATQTEITVTDHGLGIAKDDLDRIFEKYERAVDADKISGLGLGLYITKNIVDAHGGTIEVNSMVGLGSKFKVVLPL